MADTDAMFVAPSRYDLRVEGRGSPAYWAEKICGQLVPLFDPRAPTALLLGRFQPFHDGHKKLVEISLQRVGQVCIAVRDTRGIDENNPFDFHLIRSRIDAALCRHAGRFVVVQVPNITNVFYGRDVGYVVERIALEDELERISASKIRTELRLEYEFGQRIGRVRDAATI